MHFPPWEPELRPGQIIVVGLDNHIAPPSHRQQVSDILPCIVAVRDMLSERERQLSLRRQRIKLAAVQGEISWTRGVADQHESDIMLDALPRPVLSGLAPAALWM